MSEGERTFGGFGPQALPFLAALGFHQTKAWFDENRALYEAELRGPLAALVGDLAATFAEDGLPLTGSARSIFRLNRDIRFAKDKRPYKTNAGAVLSRDGTKRSPGLLYIHLDPAGCFVASGFWQPGTDEITAIRRRMLAKPKAFRDVLDSLAEAGLAFGDGDPTSRLPKGCEGAPEDLAPVVRMRNLIARRPIAEGRLASPELADDLVAFAREAEPLLRFGWAALP